MLFLPRKMFTMWKMSSYDRHIGIQNVRHNIIHAVCHDRHNIMPLSLSVVNLSVRTMLYLHFVQMAAILNFTMTPALPALFSR